MHEVLQMATTGFCSIYLLSVAEFEPLVRGLSTLDGVSIEQRGDYHVARASGEIVLHRAGTGVGEAVWFGALTGGVSGTIVEFTEQTLRVAPLTSNA
jgi:hypothetical protein